MKNRNTFFYILIVLALAAVAGLVLLLAPGSQPDTPAVLLPTPAVTDANPNQADPVSEGLVTVTPENVQVVVSTLRHIDSYSRTLTVQDFWPGGSRERSIDVWVRGDTLRLAASVNGEDAVEHLLLRDGERYVWYSDAEGVYAGPAEADDADAWQTILTYEKVLQLPARDILDAGYTDFDGTYCIFVRCRTGSMGYVSECYIDPDTGLLMGERCYDGELLFYAMDSSVPDVSTPDDSVFAVPGV